MNAQSHRQPELIDGPRFTQSGTHAVVREAVVRIPEDGFVSEALLEAWGRAQAIRRYEGGFATPEGRRFVLVEAVRILGVASEETDPYGFTGRVESIRNLIREGAIIAPGGLRLGHVVYDIEYGALVWAAASPDESGIQRKV